jgi:hypothetical protein
MAIDGLAPDTVRAAKPVPALGVGLGSRLVGDPPCSREAAKNRGPDLAHGS